MRCRRIFLYFLIVYILGLHFFLLGLILSPWHFDGLIGALRHLAHVEVHHSHYHHMRAYHERLDRNIMDKAILFVGVSHVQSLVVSAVSPRGVNFGIGQDTVSGVIDRAMSMRSIDAADTVVLAVGFNDLTHKTPEALITHYEKLVKLFKSDTKLIVNAVFPVDPIVYPSARMNERIHDFNDLLKQLCHQTPNCTFLQVDEFVNTPDGSLPPELHEGDGVHLSPQGYALWINRLRDILAVSE